MLPNMSLEGSLLARLLQFLLLVRPPRPSLGRQSPPLYLERYRRVQQSRNSHLIMSFELLRKRFPINIPLSDGHDLSVVRLINKCDQGVPRVSFREHQGRVHGPSRGCSVLGLAQHVTIP